MKSLEGSGQLSVIDGPTARRIATQPSFQNTLKQLSDISNNSKPGLGDRPDVTNPHTNFADQVHATFAKEMGMDFVTFDKKFVNFADQQLKSGGKKKGIAGLDVPAVHT